MIRTSLTGRALKTDARGFTLLETIIVLIIISIGALLVVPRLASAIDQARFQAAVRKAAAFLRQARVRAIEQGRPCKVDVTLSEGKFAVNVPERSSTASELNETNGPPLLTLPDEVKVEKEDGSRSGRSQNNSGTSDVAITFFPWGNSSGGRLMFVDKDDRRGYIDVDPISGRVRVLDSYEVS
ncbi:MAG: GspH/FimT family pseudopilin [Deltaproteobacteria bacterium]|nr:GspH/FimT family pseudopilin [Deltaproteobacteria bacterium]